MQLFVKLSFYVPAKQLQDVLMKSKLTAWTVFEIFGTVWAQLVVGVSGAEIKIRPHERQEFLS